MDYFGEYVNDHLYFPFQRKKKKNGFFFYHEEYTTMTTTEKKIWRNVVNEYTRKKF